MDMTTINLGSESVAVYYTAESDSGYERDNNGDGLPPSDSLEIHSIEYKGMEVQDLLFEFSEEGYNNLMEMVSEKINR
jgi:hypothetical protein